MTQNFRREERALVNRVSRRLNFVPARCDYYDDDDDNFCIVGASSILNRVSLSLSLSLLFLSFFLSLSLSFLSFSKDVKLKNGKMRLFCSTTIK